MLDYWADDEYVIKKSNRRAKRDKIEQGKEAFEKLNGRGLKSVILPLLAKRARQERDNEENG